MLIDLLLIAIVIMQIATLLLQAAVYRSQNMLIGFMDQTVTALMELVEALDLTQENLDEDEDGS